MDFKKANEVVHPVEKQWHYSLLTKFKFEPLDKEAVGFVRMYRYRHENGYELTLHTGYQSDYWHDKTNALPLPPGTSPYWSSLEPHLKRLKKAGHI